MKLQLVMSVLCILILACVGVSPAHANMKSVDDWYESPGSGENGSNKDVKPSEKENIEETQTAGVTFFDYVKMIFALIFVVALIYFLLKFINQKGRSFQQTKMINHLGGAPLGGNRSVQIVKVGNQVLVLGVGEDIQLLKEVHDEKEKEEILAYYHNGTEQVRDAKTVVSNLLTKVTGGTGSSEQGSFQSHFKKQLDEMSKGRKKMLKDLKDKENRSDE
ncbi:flagellar biosynthetic protein FliO [Rossellomorea aquimaris]|nr:flagellar biosynthetic protein FliO [Rossellomorea aquimaris]